MGFERKVNYVYWNASLLNKRISYPEALRIANKFSEEELRRIYLKLKARNV
jgi:hypothetical protein